MKSSSLFLDKCFELAHKAQRLEEVPVGAVIVQDNRVIAEGHNLVYTTCDPTAHAEMVALRRAAIVLGTPFLLDCDLYVTLEPCAMCATTISFARIRRLYFSAYDPKGGGVEHHGRFYDQASCFHKPEVIGGLRAQESEALLKTFFSQKRT